MTQVWLPEPPPWNALGACYGKDTELFYAATKESGQRDPSVLYGLNDDTKQAKYLCSTCPVRRECLERGFAEEWGVWGGLTAEERKRFRKHSDYIGESERFFAIQSRALFGQRVDKRFGTIRRETA